MRGARAEVVVGGDRLAFFAAGFLVIGDEASVSCRDGMTAGEERGDGEVALGIGGELDRKTFDANGSKSGVVICLFQHHASLDANGRTEIEAHLQRT